MFSFSQLSHQAKTFEHILSKLWQADMSFLFQKAKKVSLAKNLEKTFFAPLYMSSVCLSSCPYCAFRKGNQIQRRTLTEEEAKKEVQFLKQEGYSLVYCLTGTWPEGKISQKGSMTEVNARGLAAIVEAGMFPVLESSPFSEKNLRDLYIASEKKGRYVLFQECYEKEKYLELHERDPYKGNPEERILHHQKALNAGWEEVGIGALLGLGENLQREISFLVAHQKLLYESGAKLVTISVPRLTPATGMQINVRCNDEDFMRGVCILRILCPESPLVLTGRERKEIRDQLWNITDIWGVRGATEPGGYTLHPSPKDGEFSLFDRRNISEIIQTNSSQENVD